jgi:hypothetical protein
MKNKKTIAVLVISGTLVGILGVAGLFGVGKVLAADSLDDYPKIIQNLASKFGLSPDEVQQVFEDTQDERVSDRLDHLVENEDITSEQKDLIIAKIDEVKTAIEDINNQSLTSLERREAMHDLMDSLRDWADENDIPMYALHIGPRGWKMGKGGMGECFGEGPGFESM